jgi:squalene-hopene/tetraprenyl-beta-curcumene cyclase
MPINGERLDRAYLRVRSALLAERAPAGHWVGELSTSALSTATAVSALALVAGATGARGAHDHLIARGLAWLAAHQNADGGWGDTTKSVSNISTTVLCRAAFHLTGTAKEYADCLGRAGQWLDKGFGRTPDEVAEAVRARYGKDRTFSVPILMTAALAGLVAWREVPPLPFELACFPQSWFRFLRLPVVSYALPALIAIGQAVFRHRPPWNPVTRLVRRVAINRSLRVLEAIQPPGGGFLEATPLTSFVAMGLVAAGRAGHPVVGRCVEFLVKSVRPDGSWPIDTDLSTWVTTLAVNALAAADDLATLDQPGELRDWLLRQQYTRRHPYTGADPGGWAWTPLPGGVPDADDTAGAVLALAHLTQAVAPSETKLSPAGLQGLRWLRQLQNRDGGWPTFCRGWGRLAFDRSGADLTAHALRAFNAAWRLARKPGDAAPPLDDAMRRGLDHLLRTQRPDGSWSPLWFGNQYAPDDENPTYGTARVLAAYRDLRLLDSEPARRGLAWLLAAQNDDGGWGAWRGTPSSVEEASLALEVLADAGPEAGPVVTRGLDWLMRQVEAGALCEPTPIGFYFAKLWYFERLYPVVFALAALGRARRGWNGTAFCLPETGAPA